MKYTFAWILLLNIIDSKSMIKNKILHLNEL